MNPHLHGQFMTKEQEYTMGKRQPLQEVVLGKPDSTCKEPKRTTLPPRLQRQARNELETC